MLKYHNPWPVDGGRAWHEVEERLINQWVWSLLPSTYLNFLSSLQTKACKACLQNLVVSSTSRPSSAETKPSSKPSMPILALQHKQWRLELKWLSQSFLHEEINPGMDKRARDKAKTLGRWCAQRPIKHYCLRTFLSKQVSMILEGGVWYYFIVCVAEKSIVILSLLVGVDKILSFFIIFLFFCCLCGRKVSIKYYSFCLDSLRWSH